jgi:glycosyltransferase involved in cell wall biosynthesis
MDLDLIIPTHNRARLLDECLKSVLRASRPTKLNVTVVVVDNNSKDNTREVVAPYLRKSDIRFRYLFVGQPGKSAALNTALEQTDEELVGLIDDDEQLDAEWFQVAWREFSSDSAIEYIGGPCHPNWEISPPDWLPSAWPGVIGIVLRPERAVFSPQFNGMLMGGNTIVRRTTLQKVLPYPLELGRIGGKIRGGMDEIMYHRLLKIGALGMVVPDLIIYHWIPASRLTRRYYRKWAVGRGIGVGFQLRERGFPEPGLLGIPRYKFGDAARGLRSLLVARSANERFTAQLAILDCLATLYGRLLYARFGVASLEPSPRPR